MLRIFTLLLLLTPALSFALGLGEIELKSDLGEPFFAKIMITDADTIPEVGCISATDNNDPPAFRKAHIAIKNINGTHQLNISTSEVITEPIINLQVSIRCEPNLNREYVLLLDPAPTAIASSENTSISPPSELATNQTKSKSKLNPLKSQTQTLNQDNAKPLPENPSKVSDNKKRRGKKKNNAESVSNAKLMEAYTGKQETARPTPSSKVEISPKPTNIKTSTDKPYLVISNGSSDSSTNTNISSLSLRLDTQLDLTRSEIAPAPLSTIDTADEVTVMTNRLAHLEKQIIALQNQNTLLQNEAEKTKNASFYSSGFNWLKSLPISIGLILLISIISGAAWLRQKALRQRLNNEHNHWFDTVDEDSASPNNIQATHDSIFSDNTLITTSDDELMSSKNRSSFPIYPTGFTVAETDNSENVLDHVEVFLAHDRPAMAIQLLQNHLLDLPAESPEIWLKLINLLAAEGTETEYDNAVAACKQFFNVKLPKFTDASTEDLSTIEDHPHIIARLQEVWGSEFAIEFLNDLIFNKQSQPREGFGRNTFKELFFLKQIAQTLHIPKKSNKNQIDIEQSISKNSSFAPVEPTNYGMTVITEQASDTNTSVATQPPQDRLTAEAFLNTPVTTESEAELFFNETKPDINQVSSTDTTQQAAPTFEPTLKAEEIDFSEFLTAMSVESAPEEVLFPEISTQNNEPAQTSDLSTVPTHDITQDMEIPENKIEDTSEKTRSTPLMIEWELPELGKE